MIRHGIPTAGYMTVTPDRVKEGQRFLATLRPPYVLKADGLAAGKGVLILPELGKLSGNWKRCWVGSSAKRVAGW